MMLFFALLPVGYCSCTPLESFPPRFEGQAPLGSYSLSPSAKVLFPRLRPAWILMVSNPRFSRRFSIPIFPRFQSECTTVWLAFYLPRFRLFLHTQHPLYMYHMQLCLSGTCPPWLSSPLTLIHSSCRGGSRFWLALSHVHSILTDVTPVGSRLIVSVPILVSLSCAFVAYSARVPPRLSHC